MRQWTTLAQIADNPERITRSFSPRDGTALLLRPLGQEDEALLWDYFTRFGEQSRSVYRPHEFTREDAQEVCRSVGKDAKLYLLAVEREEEQERIVAYFILHFAVSPDEEERYRAAGISLDTAKTCRLAPSVADAYQDRGVGSAMMPHVREIARECGCDRMILWGGVLAHNLRARHFYAKAGFREVGLFNAGKPTESYDMMLELA
jgi:GNAT superfamily N-acetyltransferase